MAKLYKTCLDIAGKTAAEGKLEAVAGNLYESVCDTSNNILSLFSYIKRAHKHSEKVHSIVNVIDSKMSELSEISELDLATRKLNNAYFAIRKDGELSDEQIMNLAKIRDMRLG